MVKKEIEKAEEKELIARLDLGFSREDLLALQSKVNELIDRANGCDSCK